MRQCPKCKTTDYNNRNFVLMINECGHSLCKNCVENLFVRNVAPCPTCGRTLRKNQFWDQMFDDPLVEKEVFFRKKLSKIFNLKEYDFETERQYNDYLEEVETLVFNLANDVDIEATKRRIDAFQAEHEDEILRNKNRKTKDEEWISSMLEEERQFKNRIRVYEKNEKEQQSTNVVDEGRKIIKEIMDSDLPAQFLINNKKRQLEESAPNKEHHTAASAKQRPDSSAHYSSDKHVPLSSVQEVVVRHVSFKPPEGEPFVYEPVELVHNGPAIPAVEELRGMGYLAHIRAAGKGDLAGGYEESIGCYRALLEAYNELFL